MEQNNRSVGNAYEDYVCKYLNEYGIRIVERNFRNRFGEIDIIGYDGKTLVFFEVKYRKSPNAGYGEEAVGVKKRRTICKVADYYRVIHGIGDYTSVRFDVIAVNGGQIHWIKDAFGYC